MNCRAVLRLSLSSIIKPAVFRCCKVVPDEALIAKDFIAGLRSEMDTRIRVFIDSSSIFGSGHRAPESASVNALFDLTPETSATRK